MDEFSIKEGVEFRLEKHIPVAAGMAVRQYRCCSSIIWNEPDV